MRDQANDDLHYKRGPGWKKWRQAMAACVGGVLTEDIPQPEGVRGSARNH